MKPSAKRVASLYLAGGGVEKTDGGKWKATKGDKTQYFEDKDKAQAWVKGKGEDSKEDSDEPTGFAKKLMGMGKKVTEALKKLPENTQKFVGDKEYRNETSKGVAKSLKEKASHFASHAIDHFKHEMKEVGGALSAISKGEKPSKAQMKACAGLAVEIGIAAFAASTAGAGAGAATLVKGIVKHTILSTVSGGLGDAYVFGYGGTKLLGEMMRLAADEEKSKDLDEQKFAEELAKFVAKAFENGISDEVMEKAVKEMAGESKEASAEKVALLWLNK